MMSAKITTPGLLKIRVFWNNGYDVIVSVHDVAKKVLSRDWNYIINVVLMWPRFGNCTISMRKVIATSILEKFDQKNRFFWGVSWLKFNNFGLALATNLKLCTSVTKGLKLKVIKFWGPNPTFVKVTGVKLVGGPFCPPILNRVNRKRQNGIF